MTPNPYAADLNNREPISAMRDAAARIGALTSGWTPAQFERTYAPGKWTARQLLVHLAQSEMALGNRARMALSTPSYTSQAFNQDKWMALEGAMAGEVARQALMATNAMNSAFFEMLPASARETPFSHPEYGALTVDWLIHQMAGHLIHHVQHFETIAKS